MFISPPHFLILNLYLILFNYIPYFHLFLSSSNSFIFKTCNKSLTHRFVLLIINIKSAQEQGHITSRNPMRYIIVYQIIYIVLHSIDYSAKNSINSIYFVGYKYVTIGVPTILITPSSVRLHCTANFFKSQQFM